MSEKIDLFKLHKDEYKAPKKPCLVKISKAQYLSIEGQGAPGGDRFGACVGALYAMAYTIKMTRKYSGKGDYTICKLEAESWVDGDRKLPEVPMDHWRWSLMIRTPDVVGRKDLVEASTKLLEKGKAEEVAEVTLTTSAPGQCVQMLHVGPYDKEGETIGEMLTFAAEEGFKPHGRHHEIYLSDPRRVAPEKLRTILRVSV